MHGLCKAIVAAVAGWHPEIILPVGRGGFYPGTLIAHILQVELFPIRLSRREHDVVRYDRPRWLIDPPADLEGRRVLVVDEICSSGETIRLIRERVSALGAKDIRSAVLYAHSWGEDFPDYIGLVTDELVLNPWDREIFRDGTFLFHPEYVEALRLQGVTADSSLLVPTATYTLAKTPIIE
jgi:hypoxanthine phosphoribosyltransferase